MLRLVILTVFAVSVKSQIIPENPCPEFFAYRQERGVYFGEINIPYDGSKNLNLAVNISMVGLYQNLKLRLELVTPADEILSAQYLKYIVNFPFQNIIPRITQIAFNGRIYCYGPSEQVSMKGVTNLWSNIVYRINQYTYSIQTGFKQPSNPMNQYHEPTTTIEDSCGVANDIQTLVLKGEKTIENEYPWLVAMFHRQGVSYEFQCTANLITDQHVLTAGHCVWYYKAPLIDKADILLVLGRSDISHWASTGALLRTASQVTPHPNYKQSSGHCDLAIIKMNEKVIFKPTIRPICLWTGDTDLKQFAGVRGVVAGWGKSAEGRNVVAVPRKVAMPVVSQETCLRSHANFRNLTSETTFCAGNRDGSGPCNGDSGAGFIVKREGRWFLRGVVSTAIKKEDFSCDLNEFVVFSDVGKLREWIKEVIGEGLT
ncbi:serine protease gd-like [Tribolium madens]|uniref:serine protease gd-like n=1 Tax=Tribolium madens TaxID=41895 RepID=UPI001CF76219|nr:serine protease gd-like [Tribolium madens]